MIIILYMQGFSQYLKNGLLYCVIGLAAAGGLYVVSAKTALAYTVTDVSSDVSWSAGAIQFGSTLFAGSGQFRVYAFTVATSSAADFISFWNGNTDGMTHLPASSNLPIDLVPVNSGCGGTFSGYPNFQLLTLGYSQTGCSYGFLANYDSVWSEPLQFFVMNISPAGVVSFSSEPLYLTGDSISTATRIAAFKPFPYGQTVATGTNTVGFTAYINPIDYVSGEYFIVHVISEGCYGGRLCPSGVTDYVEPTWSVPNPTGGGWYEFSSSTDLSILGKTSVRVQIVNPPTGWFTPISNLLGLTSDTVLLASTSPPFTVGTTTAYDSSQYSITAAIARLTSTTTAQSVATSCNPLSSRFNLGDCTSALLWPTTAEMSDNFVTIEYSPPLGYVVRLIDILKNTTATTSLPSISYAFASTSPMAALGNIHFEPFQSIAQSGQLIGELHSDRADNATVWDIFMPFIRIFVYLVLILMIIHDLTGIHNAQVNKRKAEGGVTQKV